jgi:hypothetical protein
MSAIRNHIIGTKSGHEPLLEWIEQHKYRHYTTSHNTAAQLEYALAIAKLEDAESRELGLKLLGDIEYLREMVIEMHKELDTIHKALTKIDESLDAEKEGG